MRSEPITEAGRALLEVFTPTEVASPDFAIRLSQENVVRHAIPRIEAEAVAQERARIRAAVEAMPDCSPLAESPETIIEYGEGYCDGLFAGRSQVLRVLDPEAEGGTPEGETT